MQQCEICGTEFETECPECKKVFGPICEDLCPDCNHDYDTGIVVYDEIGDCFVNLEDLQAERDEIMAMWREMR